MLIADVVLTKFVALGSELFDFLEKGKFSTSAQPILTSISAPKLITNNK